MNEHTRTKTLIAGAIVLTLLSTGGGALIALSDDDEPANATSPMPSASPSAAPELSATPEPSEPVTPRPSESESPILEDGRHFVYVQTAIRPDGGATRVRFDLAYFLTGSEAEAAAADHGDELTNDYYIVNDNPRLRILPLADEVEVEFVPNDLCCELQQGDIDAWLESVLATNPTDYGGKDVPWWITVEGGEITRIEQQYLP